MKKRVRTHVNPLSFNQQLKKEEFKELNEKFTVGIDFEVGVGKGTFIQNHAKTNPDRHVIGVEVRQSMVENLEETLEKEDLKNVSIIHAPAMNFLAEIVPDNSINNCYIFHPDPWFKKRHHKRRVITPEFLALLYQKMKPQSKLFISTDVSSLWIDMNNKIIKNPNFQKIAEESFWETHYKTHWANFSQTDKRTSCRATYQIKKK